MWELHLLGLSLVNFGLKYLMNSLTWDFGKECKILNNTMEKSYIDIFFFCNCSHKFTKYYVDMILFDCHFLYTKNQCFSRPWLVLWCFILSRKEILRSKENGQPSWEFSLYLNLMQFVFNKNKYSFTSCYPTFKSNCLTRKSEVFFWCLREPSCFVSHSDCFLWEGQSQIHQSL